MSEQMAAAIEALEQALRTETQALRARDLTGAAAMQPAKAAAVEAFLRLRGSTPANPALARQVDRLRTEVQANREMLEGAMALQARVVKAIARAARPTTSGAPGYAVSSRPATAALALSMKA